MRQSIPLRLDYDAVGLRRIARKSEDADQVRRLLALAVIYEGSSRMEAAEVGGVTVQVVRVRIPPRTLALQPPSLDRRLVCFGAGGPWYGLGRPFAFEIPGAPASSLEYRGAELGSEWI